MSLPVSIELNTDLQPFFTLPGRFHLSFENPGPVEVDPDSLTDLERLWINQGALTGALRVENPNKKEDKKPEPAKAEEPPKQGLTFQEGIEHPQRDKMVEGIKKLLSGKVASIKKAIKGSDDILFLRLVREVEVEGKARTSVLDAVNSEISALQSKLAETVGASEGDALGYFVTDPSLRNLPEIEEEAGETITIRPMTDED